MKIKYRITLLFTALVTTILFIVCVLIFYFSDLNRQNDFKNRLRNRALTTIGLLIEVEGLNKDLLHRIDEATLIALQQKSVTVYDDSNNEVYSYTDDGAKPVRATIEILNKARQDKEYFFTEGKRTAVALRYTDKGIRYIVVAAAYDKDGFEKLNRLLLILVLSFISGVLITLLSGLFFSTRLVAPIQKITREVKEISSQNLSRRIDVQEPRDELNELSATFNNLLSRLQESFEIQRRFIANASHELSTPLTSISGQLEITLQNERTAAEYKTIIQSVYEDVKMLNQLTRSLLELAKASGTTDGIELSLVRIDDLLMRLPAELRKTDEKYTVALHFDSFPEEEDQLYVFGNSDLLYSAIKNIVVNGCKYSPDHFAKVALQFSDTALNISIIDRGPGISEAEKQLVFQPFYRSAHTTHAEGFGLGLSLASRIIQLHKGKLSIESTPGQGSIFIISLPVARSFHQL